MLGTADFVLFLVIGNLLIIGLLVFAAYGSGHSNEVKQGERLTRDVVQKPHRGHPRRSATEGRFLEKASRWK